MARDKELKDLFLDTLKDIYFAEKKILSALPKMAKAAQSPKLKAAFEKHMAETDGQVERLEQVFASIDETPKGKTCDAIMGIIEEGKEVMDEYKGMPALDAGLLAAAQAVEHYEISRYGTLKTWANELGYADAVKLLDATLKEEKATDSALSSARGIRGQPARRDRESRVTKRRYELRTAPATALGPFYRLPKPASEVLGTEKHEPDEGHDNDRDAQTNNKQEQHRRTRFCLTSFRRRLDDYVVFFDNHHRPPSLVPPLQCDNMLAVMAIVLVETDLFGYVAVLNLLPLDLETTWWGCRYRDVAGNNAMGHHQRLHQVEIVHFLRATNSSSCAQRTRRSRWCGWIPARGFRARLW